jgi:bacteriocin-like protein
MEEVLRELSDTELDAVSGGAVAVGASSSLDTGGAVAAAVAATITVTRVVGTTVSTAFTATTIGAGAAVGVTSP